MLADVCEKDFWSVLQNTIPYWEEMNDNQVSSHQICLQPGAHFYISWVCNH